MEAGIEKVVIGSKDPNPLVNGGGIHILEREGVEVLSGVLEKECDWMNRGFLMRMTKHRPWITVKAAVGIDGAMCLSNGESKWITSPWSRRIAHLLRSANDAVMVGKGTVLADDPQLTVRSSYGRSPLKVVLDSNVEVPGSSNIFRSGKSLVYTRLDREEAENRSGFRKEGINNTEFIRVASDDCGVDISSVVEDLGNKGVNYLLVEGGPAVISSLLSKKLADSIILFISPRIMGYGTGIADKMTFRCMENTISVRDVRINRIGTDLILEGLTSCSPDW